jgi:AraC-like DNA-binding protein
LLATVVLKETDMYREFRPPPQLRSSIACLWTRSGDGGAVRVMPDACTDIVWRAGNGAAVAGPDTGHWFSATEPGQAIVGVRLLPGAGGAALRLPLAELRDQRVAVSDLGLDPHAQLDPDARPEEVVRRLAALAISLTAAGRPDRAAQAAAIRLMNPGQRVDRLASELGFSERQLRRRFAVAVGYGPKMLQRVLRLRRFLNADAASLAQAALEAGYSDQAHLSRDCRELTGLTPLQLLSGTAEREDADRTELKSY